MGTRFSHPHPEPLSEETLSLCRGVFTEIDTDHGQFININEAKEWWKNNYSVINSRAMFEAVDENHDGLIELSEWIKFWTMVKSKGHSEEEIREELRNIGGKLSWVQLDGVPILRPTYND